MIIGSIVNGVVIDHIPAGRGMELYYLLKLDELDCEVALIKNAASEKRGKKDILKIGDLPVLNYDVLGYVSRDITVNIIQDGKRVRKYHPTLPERLEDVIRCKNPRCITSIELGLKHIFRLTDPESGTYRCIYCDTRYGE